MYRFNPNYNWVNYTYPGGLSGGFERDDGSVWFHSQKQAVQFHKGVWMGYGPEDGFLDGEVYGLHQTSQALWFIGTHKGHHAVARYEDSAWRIFTAADGLIDEVYKPRRLQRLNAGVDFTFLQTVVEARDGSVWFLGKHAGGAAVCRWDGSTFTRYTASDGLVGEWAHVAYEASDGSMWFATWQSDVDSRGSGGGLYRFDGSGFTRFTKSDGLSDDLVIDVSEWPKGTLWVGTVLGLDNADLSAKEITWQNKTDFEIDFPKPRSFVPTSDAL
ncbi:MAG: ligand-binding sensor domain-containing protein [Candidatus Latescibacterota bacterium]